MPWKKKLIKIFFRHFSRNSLFFFFSFFFANRSIALISHGFGNKRQAPLLSIINFVSSTYPISIKLMISRRYIIFVGRFLARIFPVHLPDWIYLNFFFFLYFYPSRPESTRLFDVRKLSICRACSRARNRCDDVNKKLTVALISWNIFHTHVYTHCIHYIHIL